MVKTVIHLADIHLRTYRMHDEYKEVFQNLLDDLTMNLLEYKREEIRIVIVGDLVHQKIIISNEQLIIGTWFLRELEKIAPVVIIAGNHDLLENNKDRMDSITPMVQFLADKEINYFKESNCYLDDNIVWCVYSIFDGNSRPNIEKARLDFGSDKTYIGLFHAPIMNAKTDIGYVINHGAELSIFEDCDLVMLGDIHKRDLFLYEQTKEINTSDVSDYEILGWKVENYNKTSPKTKITKTIPISYCGSLIQQNFGENISKHGYLLWDVKTRTYISRDIENPYLFYNFKINSMKDIENGSEKLTNT